MMNTIRPSERRFVEKNRATRTERHTHENCSPPSATPAQLCIGTERNDSPRAKRDHAGSLSREGPTVRESRQEHVNSREGPSPVCWCNLVQGATASMASTGMVAM